MCFKMTPFTFWTGCKVGSCLYSHVIFGSYVCWVKTKDNLLRTSVTQHPDQYFDGTKPKNPDIPLSWITLHMWLGWSVKCLVIRSPLDASTRRSQLRQTKVTLNKQYFYQCSISIKQLCILFVNHKIQNLLTLMKMGFCYNPFSEVFSWCCEIWQRKQSYKITALHLKQSTSNTQ